MDILSHLRTIEELIKTLSYEQRLLNKMFGKRKPIKFPKAIAPELVGGNEGQLSRFIDYGIAIETGNSLEIESNYLNFFEEVPNVNEEISVLSVQGYIDISKEHIIYFLQKMNIDRKAGCQDNIRQLLKKASFRTLGNVADLKRNMDNTYKQEPNHLSKKTRLQNLSGKSHSIRLVMREYGRLTDNEQVFFIITNDPHMAKTYNNIKRDFVEAYHALTEIDRQIIVYISQIDRQSQLYKRIRKLEYLKDQVLVKTRTNITQVLEDNNSL